MSPVHEQPVLALDEQALRALEELAADGTAPSAIVSEAVTLLAILKHILGADPRLAATVQNWINNDPHASELRQHLCARRDRPLSRTARTP